MSLTNPKNVVTEERLSEFYGQILPYLGGMPEALANKFSKADLYSTDEKIVGCWTDGRPLYQKTFIDTFGTITDGTVSSKSISDLGSSISIQNIKGFCNGTPIGCWGATTQYFFRVCMQGTILTAECNRSVMSDKQIKITIQYTKTTDAANSFKYGNETDYSTSEKIVGTWIDGKPIYQKTMNFGVGPNNDTKAVNHNVSNIDILVGCEAFGVASNGSMVLINDVNQYGTDMLYNRVIISKTQVQMWTNTDRSTVNFYVTMRYTKTTD